MRSSLTPRALAIAALAAVTVIGGLAFMFTGRAAELGQYRDITVTVLVSNVPSAVTPDVKPGDLVYTDPAAMNAGTIDEVRVDPQLVASPDSRGELQLSENPLLQEVTIVFTTKGRQTSELIATGNQVVQVGQQFTVITKAVQLRGTITRIDVR
jgi:hypothetical protein